MAIFNPTTFFHNISHGIDTTRKLIHSVSDDVPVVGELGELTGEALTIGKKVSDIGEKVSSQFIDLDKEPLRRSDIQRDVHIFGHDVSIPVTPIEVLFQLGRKNADAPLGRVERAVDVVQDVKRAIA